MFFQEKLERFRERVRELYATNPHHTIFFNRVVHSLAPEMFPEDATRLYSTDAWDEFIELYNLLAPDEGTDARGGAPAQMSVRGIPKRLYQALKDQAHREKTSLNKLCVRNLAASIGLTKEGLPFPCPRSSNASTLATPAASSSARADEA